MHIRFQITVPPNFDLQKFNGESRQDYDHRWGKKEMK
jgi:hypothetical protein